MWDKNLPLSNSIAHQLHAEKKIHYTRTTRELHAELKQTQSAEVTD